MPNMDPRTMRNLMAKMGIKTTELPARRVVIECDDKNIIVEEPQITMIDAQGAISFQIAGRITEAEHQISIEISDDDVKLVMEKSGKDQETARKALEESKGDIAEAILNLSEPGKA